MELRKKQEQEVTERRTLEQGMQHQVNSLQQTISEQNRKREESLHALDMLHREKEHAAENEKLKLQGRMTETVEEVNKLIVVVVVVEVVVAVVVVVIVVVSVVVVVVAVAIAVAEAAVVVVVAVAIAVTAAEVVVV
ncbi:neurofilament heavy polypeptide-like isoform X5 [Elysia marginata]|uniref:Neurofilament heavy polypeptide-like isoform X5 n=1 Tax=Elysia marginata TaxID=1093978 RepID=A0AAV4HTG8_9GAST|nr:neurofilament heavy polypeptide-like isoform X5 [Elysia marginata]